MLGSRASLLLLGILFSPALSLAAEWRGSIKGRVQVRAAPGKVKLSEAAVYLHTTNGEELRTYCDSDGSFEFMDVGPGSHMAQAQLIGYYFPEVRLDVSPNVGLMRASFLPPNDKQAGSLAASPLVLHAVGELQYYDKRKPVDVMSFLKSPYGIMIVISAAMIFVFPKMKVDPEEYKEFQKTLGTSTATAADAQPRIQGR